jgi:hypothetical protein
MYPDVEIFMSMHDYSILLLKGQREFMQDNGSFYFTISGSLSVTHIGNERIKLLFLFQTMYVIFFLTDAICKVSS